MNETLPAARATASRTVNQAKAGASGMVNDAQGRAARFGNQRVAFKQAPDVFPARNYLETLRTTLASTRKYVVLPTNTQDVVILDLTEKLRRDLLDVPVDAVKTGGDKK